MSASWTFRRLCFWTISWQVSETPHVVLSGSCPQSVEADGMSTTRHVCRVSQSDAMDDARTELLAKFWW